MTTDTTLPIDSSLRSLDDDEIDATAGGMRLTQIPRQIAFALATVVNAIDETIATVAAGECK